MFTHTHIRSGAARIVRPGGLSPWRDPRRARPFRRRRPRRRPRDRLRLAGQALRPSAPDRANFGDPRTIFFVPPTTDSRPQRRRSFTFHFGVDISAPDGTQVYPGRLRHRLRRPPWRLGRRHTGDGRSFQYWHIQPAVDVGARVEADKTVLDTILKGQEHVHLTESDDHGVVNPLQAGHLTPFADRTKPSVDAITFRATDLGRDLMPNFLRGSIELIAEAYDTPSIPVPGSGRACRSRPHCSPGICRRWRVGSSARRTSRPTSAGRSRPTRSSGATTHAGRTRTSRCSAPLLIRAAGVLPVQAHELGFDTRSVPDGIYDLVVTATDIRGNTARSRRITIHNRSGWAGS